MNSTMSSKNTKRSSTKARVERGNKVLLNGFAFVKSRGGISEYLLLKNGLRILYCNTPKTGSVTVNVVYEVGSRHEARGKTGLAHMLEHMMFKETLDLNGSRVSPPRYVALQNDGAELNATTWNDRTNYYFSMPASYLPDILKAEAERMRGLIIEDAEFLPERQNVLSEFEMYADRPGSALETAIVGAAFASHGYGHDTIGFRSDIEHATADDLKNFYDLYYWPDNAYVVVVGDVTVDEVLTEVKRHFGQVPKSGHAFPQSSFEEPKQEGPRTVEVRRKNPLTIVMVMYGSPAGTDRQWTHARLALSHLAGGKLSMLHRTLIETNKASSVSPLIYPTHDRYLMGIEATVDRREKPETIRDAIVDAVAAFKKRSITETELDRIKQRMLADTLFDRDGTNAIARELTEYIAMGSWELYHDIVSHIQETTVKDIEAVVRSYFSIDQSTIGIFRGTRG